MSDIRLVRVTPETISDKIRFPVIAYVAIEGESAIASFGLAWHHERCWLWFGVETVKARHAVYVVRWARRMLRVARQMGEIAVYSMRSEGPKSKQLHERLGFTLIGTEPVTFDDGRENVEEIWVHNG